MRAILVVLQSHATFIAAQIDAALGWPAVTAPPGTPGLDASKPGPGWTITEGIPMQHPTTGAWAYPLSANGEAAWELRIETAQAASPPSTDDSRVLTMAAPGELPDDWFPPPPDWMP